MFDGEALRPISPFDLEPNTSYRISKELPPASDVEAPDSWDELEVQAGSIEAPRAELASAIIACTRAQASR